MTLTKEQIDLLILNKIIPQGCPQSQIDFFATVCEKKKLDPMLKQIHMVGRKSKDDYGKWITSYTIQAGIDGMRVIAQRNCKIISYKRWTEKREDDLYGICEIDTEDRGKYYDELPFKEYVQTKADGTTNHFWKQFPQTMIKKCAEESVLRMMSPEDLSGVYGDDEMSQADSETTKQKELPKANVQIEEAKTINEQAPGMSSPEAIHLDQEVLIKINKAKTATELKNIWFELSDEDRPKYTEVLTTRKSILKANIG